MYVICSSNFFKMCGYCVGQQFRQFCLNALMNGSSDPRIHKELQETLLRIIYSIMMDQPSSRIPLSKILDPETGSFFYGQQTGPGPLCVKIQRFYRGLNAGKTEDNPIIIN